VIWVESMKDSHQVLVIVGVLILIGIVLIGLSKSINIPSAYNPFLSAQAFFSMGFFFLGFSFGVLGAIGYIVRLEKKIPQNPPPP
jgi:amino acid transporter